MAEKLKPKTKAERREEKKPYTRGPKRASVTERERDYATMAEMERRGYSQREIAEAVGLTEGTISKELKVLRERYAEAALTEHRGMVMRELHLLMDVRNEAWQQWLKAKAGEPTITVEELESQSGKGGYSKRIEKRDSGSEWLRIVLETNREIRKLFSLDEAAKVQVDGTVNVLNWDALFGAAPDPRRDPIGERLRLEAAAPPVVNVPAEPAGSAPKPRA